LSEGKWWFGSSFQSDADDHWTVLMFVPSRCVRRRLSGLS
jgi:hypothetical protein